MNRTPAILAELRAEIESAPPTELPSIRGQLAALEAELLVRLTTPQASESSSDDAGEEEQCVDVEAAAKMLGMSKRYVYKHAKEYGGAKFGGALRFPTKRLNGIIKRRSYENN